MIRIAVLLSGRGSNLQALLDACATGRIDGQICVVVSDVADARGLERAQQAEVEAIFLDPATYETKNRHNQALVDLLTARQIDLVCLAGYMRIIRKPLLDAFEGRMLNIHPSLLPAFPGLDAQRQAFDYGVKVTGCTVHFVTAGMDEGPIILQAAVPVLPDDTLQMLTERILVAEHRIYPEAVQLFAQGRLRVDSRHVRVE
jgi:phosphoribosylglycinamide formyltransferase-1